MVNLDQKHSCLTQNQENKTTGKNNLKSLVFLDVRLHIDVGSCFLIKPEMRAEWAGSDHTLIDSSLRQ